ncbi:molybdopterin molybdotransferase MoeA [Microvirga pudoricolor]|uniref:molybdopterin molybdotransferase MoeA n=1 Tax=Microvirga pudoricolor TaxID=2778729 RepID=UPI00194F68A9|nr:gephyrin-like molybdotransferase Glp [Microvirga pudoricolor]MBM6595755.1 molybdopterin molybdotransferase MoeA [Microvirga pudoricolor]
MSLLPVSEALSRILAGASRPTEIEQVPVAASAGLTLARDLKALRDQPPFRASAMDGYAIRSADAASVPATLRIVGTSAAGKRFTGAIGPGETVRIFTGAPVPDSADAVVLQEDTERSGDRVTVNEASRPGRHLRAAGLDFLEGDPLLRAGQRMDARHIALGAAMGHGTVPVHRRPRVAILATGDELVRPGERAGPDQITASSLPAVAAMVVRAGGEPIDLGIARDTMESLDAALGRAEAEKADILVTLGGASVGDHDLVQKALAARGMSLEFWRVALRPGKPLMHGRLGSMLLLGLPGNPVSSFVCAILFLVPAIRALSGDPDADADGSEGAVLATDVPENGPRQDYMRARLHHERKLEKSGPLGEVLSVTPHEVQDSSLLGLLQSSDALLIRPPHAPAGKAGDPCRIVRMERFC